VDRNKIKKNQELAYKELYARSNQMIAVQINKSIPGKEWYSKRRAVERQLDVMKCRCIWETATWRSGKTRYVEKQLCPKSDKVKPVTKKL